MNGSVTAERLKSSPYDLFPEGAFSREDETEDAIFYARDRFVSHLDSTALSTVESVIGQLAVGDYPVVLDLMASWDSHIPPAVNASRVVGLGLNRDELARNERLTEVVLHDLNRTPELPFPDETFDLVVNTVSVDYLVRPFDVFAEVGRVLKTGGLFVVIFSNRMFPRKATRIWKEATEAERVKLVERFFEWNGRFDAPSLFVSSGKPRPGDDKYAYLGIPSDPVYVVYAEKRGEGAGTGERFRPDLPEEGSIDEPCPVLDREAIRSSLQCPHCGERMEKWQTPNDPFSTWDTDFMYICFNDFCPYVVRGWQTMTKQGNQGLSYRFMFDPQRRSCLAIPVRNLHALREGIVE
ncbi:MAG: methyltransferase domain-containing protein [Acidobacteriota bacterium]